MIRVTPFSSLIGSYPIYEHAVQFFTVAEEWQQFFWRYLELQNIFNSVQTPDGSYRISLGDVFAGPDTRHKIINALIWGFPNGYRGMHTLCRIMDNLDS